MLNKLLTVLLPIALPIAIYWLYLAIARRQQAKAGATGETPGWHNAPWGWILLVAAVLMAGALIGYRIYSGEEPGFEYQPPELGGDVEPGLPGNVGRTTPER